ncbi:hypothetical protein EV175_003230 [Coemansia sp. RSA 1933]|nr:hypothetical protein EV175_003230 [Coemansia sp. RSA 1933]
MNVSSSGNDDPLHQIVSVLDSHSVAAEAAAAVTALGALYKRSSDVRAVLRLVDPRFMDMLSMANSFAPEDSKAAVGAGTRLVRLLEAQTLKGSSEAAEMLAAMVDSGSSNVMQKTMGVDISVLRDSVVQTILQCVKESMDASSFVKLLGAMDRGGTDETVLVSAIVDALLIDNDAIESPAASQLLQLLTFVMEQRQAMDALATHPALRALTRRIIGMLSAPAPLVAAPALNAITQLVLSDADASTPLGGLSSSLRAKLFDADHIGRTLTLMADFCMHCSAQSSVEDDLVVLDAVAGTVDAIVRCSGTARDLFAQSTVLIPAFVHLQQQAAHDHRFLTPLLSLVSSAASLSADVRMAATPLLQALLLDNTQGGECIAMEAAESVVLCIEDAVDMMMPFPLALGSGQLLVSKGKGVSVHRPTWLSTSNEAGYGWYFNAGFNERQRTGQQLESLLSSIDSRGAYSRGVVWRILDAVANPYLGEASRRGVAKAHELDVEMVESQLAQHLTSIGCHYWILTPLLELVANLAQAIGDRAPHAGYELEESHNARICALLLEWAQSVGSSGGASLRQEALALFASDSSAEQQTVPSAVTPDSAFSSPGSGTRVESIAIDDLRAANKDTVSAGGKRLAQLLLVGHWKHTCDDALARLLANLIGMISEGTSNYTPAWLPSNDSLAVVHDCVSVVADLHAQHLCSEEAARKALQQIYAGLSGAEARNAELQGALQGAHDQVRQLRETSDQLEHERLQLKTALEELHAEHRRAQTDASEWRDECVATRGLLEASDRTASQTREQLDRLSEAHARLQRQHAADRDRSDTRAREMASSNAELERALADAVLRLRDLEAQTDLDRSVNDELRRQNAAMSMRLSEFAKLSESLHNIARTPK